MRILIDTSAYAALAKGDTRVLSLLEEAEEIIVSTVVLGELYAGFALGSRRARNLAELKQFLDQPGVRVVPPTHAVAQRYGEVIRVLRRNGTPIPTNDVWISSTALETGSRVLSFHAHFALVPGVLLAD